MSLFALIPILLILFSGVISNFFEETPEFSLTKSWSYSIRR